MKSSKAFFIILTKQGDYYILTQVLPFIQPYMNESHHFRKLMAYTVIILKKESNSKKYGMTRTNMSTVMNEGFKMHYKSVT